MPHLALLLAALASAAPAPGPPPENLLRGPTRCLLRYLEAVRLAGPRGPSPARAGAREADYAAARRLTAPRALEEIGRRTAAGEDHPLAPWRGAARGTVLESFQLLAVRRAPRGTAVVTVRERWWRAGADEALARSVSEYLVGRVEGEWRVVDRREGGAFHDGDIVDGYAGWFDVPPALPAIGADAGERDEGPQELDVTPSGWGAAAADDQEQAAPAP